MSVFPSFLSYDTDGVPSWHSNSTTRPSFTTLARHTDPLQEQVHAHLIRRCPHITRIYHFGRPTFDRLKDNEWYNGVDDRQFPTQINMIYHPCTIVMGWMTEDARQIWIAELNDLIAHLLGVPPRVLSADQLDGLLPRRRRREGDTRSTIPIPPFEGGMWLTGQGYSVEMNPELYAAIAENEVDIDLRTAAVYRTIYDNAVRRNTTRTLGEWGCNKCGFDHSFQTLGSQCNHIGRNGHRCNGRLCMAITRDGVRVKMTAYAVAPNCPNTGQKCIGMLDTNGWCSCGLVPRRNKYLDGYDMSQRTRAPATFHFHAYRNGEPIEAIRSSTGLCRTIRPVLERGIRDGTLDLGWFQRNDMVIVLKRYGRGPRTGEIIGVQGEGNLCILSFSRMAEFLATTYFSTRPRWSIVLEGKEYRVDLWTTREDLA
eukprot:scaffold6933_cov80-Skeletonema_marinoi.AAC.3